MCQPGSVCTALPPVYVDTFRDKAFCHMITIQAATILALCSLLKVNDEPIKRYYNTSSSTYWQSFCLYLFKLCFQSIGCAQFEVNSKLTGQTRKGQQRAGYPIPVPIVRQIKTSLTMGTGIGCPTLCQGKWHNIYQAKV